MKRKHIILLIIIITSNFRIVACNMNIDSLFSYQTTALDKYLESVIEGYILPSSYSEKSVMADINRNPIKTNYTDSTKFFVFKNATYFLEMLEDIMGYKWERDTFVPTYQNKYKRSSNDKILVRNKQMQFKL